jgi:hypothetical protein
MQAWRNCQVLSEQINDSPAFLYTICLLEYVLKCDRHFSLFIFRSKLTVTRLARVYCIHKSTPSAFILKVILTLKKEATCSCEKLLYEVSQFRRRVNQSKAGTVSVSLWTTSWSSLAFWVMLILKHTGPLPTEQTEAPRHSSQDGSRSVHIPFNYSSNIGQFLSSSLIYSCFRIVPISNLRGHDYTFPRHVELPAAEVANSVTLNNPATQSTGRYISASITVAAQSRARNVFVRWNAGILGSNPTQRMNVYMCLFRVCVVLCVGRRLTTGWSPVQGVQPIVYKIKNLKKPSKSKGL